MLISEEFDESNKERRKRVNRTALDTAEKLNRRMIQFLYDTNKSYTLNDKQKKKIRETLLKHL